MSIKTPTAENDTGIEIPNNWTRTRFNGRDQQTFERTDDDGVVRIKRELSLQSADACNHARHSDDEGTLVVLVNDEPLPSPAAKALDGGNVEEAIEAARAAMEERR